MKEKTKNFKKQNHTSHISPHTSSKKGITLIALILTIIIMLILATVTIGAINGGLFEYAGKAKKDTTVASEKSQIEMAYIIAKDLSKTGRVTESNLQKQLDKQLGENASTTYQMEDGFEIFITDTDRYYELYNNGNLVAKELIKDAKPANLYYDKDGNALNGTTKPYEINCIEDLVALANLANGAGNYIDADGNITDITELSNFSGKNFVLTRTLNFESPASYSDLSIKWSYDSTNDAYIIDNESTTNLKEIITDKNGVGFVPIAIDTGSGHLQFAGNLDGQKFEIQNIYENRPNKPGGLFRTLYKATIQNLGITGEYHLSEGGGFTHVSNAAKFYNCYNEVDIEEGRGGFASVGIETTVINCYNNGDISANSAGGFFGGAKTTAINSYNKGTMKGRTGSYSGAGNFIASSSNGKVNIINSCALGNISSTKNVSIVGYAYGSSATITLDHCYYLPSIVVSNSSVVVNEGAIAITDLEDTLDELNTFVAAHKNDYAVPLKEWTIKNGELMFKD